MSENECSVFTYMLLMLQSTVHATEHWWHWY